MSTWSILLILVVVVAVRWRILRAHPHEESITPLYAAASYASRDEALMPPAAGQPTWAQIRGASVPSERSCSEQAAQPCLGAREVAPKKFQIELIPRSMHAKNARAVLSIDAWCCLRNLCLKFAGEQCEVCGSTDEGKLECHEEWEYESLRRFGNDELVHVMRLKGLRALCRLCHGGKHIGFASKNADEYSNVKSHVRTVHGLSEEKFAQLKRDAFDNVTELDRCGTRELDLTYLNDERFYWVRQRTRRGLFSSNELANCRQPAANDDLAA